MVLDVDGNDEDGNGDGGGGDGNDGESKHADGNDGDVKEHSNAVMGDGDGDCFIFVIMPYDAYHMSTGRSSISTITGGGGKTICWTTSPGSGCWFGSVSLDSDNPTSSSP